MQKVEGSSPFIRSEERLAAAGLSRSRSAVAGGLLAFHRSRLADGAATAPRCASLSGLRTMRTAWDASVDHIDRQDVDKRGVPCAPHDPRLAVDADRLLNEADAAPERPIHPEHHAGDPVGADQRMARRGDVPAAVGNDEEGRREASREVDALRSDRASGQSTSGSGSQGPMSVSRCTRAWRRTSIARRVTTVLIHAAGSSTGSGARLFVGPDSDLTLTDVERARAGISPSVGRRAAYRPTLWLGDAATAVTSALGVPAGTYNVADDEPPTRAEIDAALAAAIGRAAVEHWDVDVPPLLEAVARSQRVSSRRLREASGWAPRVRGGTDGWRLIVQRGEWRAAYRRRLRAGPGSSQAGGDYASREST